MRKPHDCTDGSKTPSVPTAENVTINIGFIAINGGPPGDRGPSLDTLLKFLAPLVAYAFGKSAMWLSNTGVTMA